MGSQVRIVAEVNDNGVTTGNKLNLNGNVQGMQNIEAWMGNIVNGSISAKLTVAVAPVKASGTVTLASFQADDTITVNGNVFTAKASPSGAAEFALGASDEAAANNFAAKINASTTSLIVNTVTASRRGTSTISGMVANDTVTINGVVFTCKAAPTNLNTEFLLGTSVTATAANLVRAIQRNNDFRLKDLISAANSAGVVTVNYAGSLVMSNSAHGTIANKVIVLTCKIGGQIGNLCSLAISARGSVSGAVMTGGTEGTVSTISKGL